MRPLVSLFFCTRRPTLPCPSKFRSFLNRETDKGGFNYASVSDIKRKHAGRHIFSPCTPYISRRRPPIRKFHATRLKNETPGVTQRRANKKHNTRGGGRLCKELEQLITVRGLPSDPSPPFLVLIQPSTLHHSSHNLDCLGSVDRNESQKLGNG